MKFPVISIELIRNGNKDNFDVIFIHKFRGNQPEHIQRRTPHHVPVDHRYRHSVLMDERDCINGRTHMKVTIRLNHPSTEIDVTDGIIGAIASEISRIAGGNEVLNRLEAEMCLDRILAGGHSSDYAGSKGDPQ